MKGRVDESDPRGCGWRRSGWGVMYVATRRRDEAAVPKGTGQAVGSRLGTGRQGEVGSQRPVREQVRETETQVSGRKVRLGRD